MYGKLTNQWYERRIYLSLRRVFLSQPCFSSMQIESPNLDIMRTGGAIVDAVVQLLAASSN